MYLDLIRIATHPGEVAGGRRRRGSTDPIAAYIDRALWLTHQDLQFKLRQFQTLKDTERKKKRSEMFTRLGEKSLVCCHVVTPNKAQQILVRRRPPRFKQSPNFGRGVNFILLLRQRNFFTSQLRSLQAMANTQDAGAIVESWYSTESDLS
jgi:hypothetical protein